MHWSSATHRERPSAVVAEVAAAGFFQLQEVIWQHSSWPGAQSVEGFSQVADELDSGQEGAVLIGRLHIHRHNRSAVDRCSRGWGRIRPGRSQCKSRHRQHPEGVGGLIAEQANPAHVLLRSDPAIRGPGRWSNTAIHCAHVSLKSLADARIRGLHAQEQQGTLQIFENVCMLSFRSFG